MSFTVRRVKPEKKPSKLRKALSLSLPIIQVALQLRRHAATAKDSDTENAKQEKKMKRGLALLVAGLLLLILLIGTLRLLVRLKDVALGMASMVGAELPSDEDGYTNVLLLGEGNADHDGTDLTDTIMVASLDPTKTRSAVLLSIPRDTYVLQSEKMGKGRINSLYRDYKGYLLGKGKSKQDAARESLEEFMKEVGRHLGITLHGVVKVNFSGFEETVDLLGGVDIEVPDKIVDIEYPGPNYTYETFVIDSGLQHLDGKTALKYARTRHTTSDFSRSGRQQQIIGAIAKKVNEQGLVKAADMVDEMLAIISRNVQTTFSTRELLGLASMGREIETDRIVSMQLNDQNGLFGTLIEPGGFLYSPPREEFDGAAVLLPVSIPEFPVTWKQIQVLCKVLLENRELFVRGASIVTLNAGAKEGSARKLGGELYRYGLNVIGTRNAGPRGSIELPSSVIAINPALKEDTSRKGQRARALLAAKFLSKLLSIEITEEVTPLAFEKENADVALLLGEDYTLQILQDLVTLDSEKQ